MQCPPGDPENMVKGGTTVSGGSTVLSAIAQQSFRTHRRPYSGLEQFVTMRCMASKCTFLYVLNHTKLCRFMLCTVAEQKKIQTKNT